jgi:hypothetical protein
MMITFDVFILSRTLLGSGRQDKYPRVGMRNIVCIVFADILTRCDVAPVVPDSKIVLPFT